MSNGPDVWGPHGWKFIHFIALGYPTNPSQKDKEEYKIFFTLFGDIIPCSLCGNHYKKNLKKHNIDKYLDTKYDLIKWTILMHNEVNESRGKKIYNFDEGVKMILDGSEPIHCNKNSNKELFNDTINYSNGNKNEKILIVILIIIIICLSVLLCKK